jgi:hypothetical protein
MENIYEKNKPLNILNINNYIIEHLKNNDAIDIDNIDVKQILDICNYYNKNYNKKNDDILSNSIFIRNFKLFQKIIYFCLKLNINIFKKIKNNYFLKTINHTVESCIDKKKIYIKEHIEDLNILTKKNVTNDNFTEKITNLHQDLILKINLVDKIIKILEELACKNIICDNDNLLTLVIPFFIKHELYIEEYSN